VYDSEAGSGSSRSFGRVIYTDGKSLIYYAFDLDKVHGGRKVSFQAWGERESEQKDARKLGVFYVDDAAQNANGYHGSLFESVRNQVMDATDWFVGCENAVYGSKLKQSPLRMNDFGGTLSGPILKNRLFFFVAHESLYMNQPQPLQVGDVPDEATRSSAAAVFQPYLNAYPIGNSRLLHFHVN
jgi:hypothetical protein